jgi:penicillin-binding protein 1B
MQTVVREGTGQGLAGWLAPELAIAGKTGTTDEQRDAWFAGFTGDRLGVVWIGYDDNRAAKLTGSAAALPVWGEMMAALDPEPLEVPMPDGIERVWIDPESGLRGSGCPGAVEVPFMQGSAPEGRAACADNQTVERVKGFFERIFGR